MFIALYRGMYGKSGVSGGTSARTGRMDVAVLYMRLFIGAMLMLHVIGKLQEYNASVSGFPGLLFDSPAVTFVIFTVLEAAFALMIISGVFVRLAAIVMAVGMFVDIFLVYPTYGWIGVERQVLYIGIYVFLAISGGGSYSMYVPLLFYRKKSPN